MAAKGDIFHNPTSSVPKSDPKIERIDFDKEDFGARKSHINGLHKKNGYTIGHVKGS